MLLRNYVLEFPPNIDFRVNVFLPFILGKFILVDWS